MRRFAVIFFLASLGLLSCGPGEKQDKYEPAIRVEIKDISAYRVSFSINTIDAKTLAYGYGTSASPEMNLLMDTGSLHSTSLSLEIGSLAPDTDYFIDFQGLGPGGEKGAVVSLEFSTSPGQSQLYSWERSRSAVPSFADITLVTLGQHNYNPPLWTKERFASHVLYTDENGSAHWLYDAFLCIDGYDGKRGLSFSITNNRYSAVKESWEDLLDAWLGSDGALLKLDEAISDASARLGELHTPRYVVMSLPDPIRFQFFGDKNSSTAYWGALGGRQLDFSRTEDQEAAYKWYMDACRERFNALKFRNIELAGFYILSEELPLDPAFFREAGKSYDYADTWNWEYKRWEVLVPWVAEYAHSCNEGLWWVPYHLAPGYKVWKELGFDCAFMQPNHYWDTADQHPMSKSVAAIRQYRMGIELEFEYSLVAEVMADGRFGPDGSGNATFTKDDIPALRDRLREYFRGYKETGLYGVLPLAVYSGTDAMHQLAVSKDEGDKAFYHELCHYIIDSPLKK